MVSEVLRLLSLDGNRCAISGGVPHSLDLTFTRL